MDLISANAPLEISALGVKNPTVENFRAELKTTLAQIKAFNAKWGALGAVKSVEIVLPDKISETASTRLLEPHGFEAATGLSLFVEIPFNSQWSNTLPHVLDACARQRVGFKLRTGGIAASAFPTSLRVADAILGCSARNVPLKCTAGLHHPLRRYDASVQTEMYGFVNVFAAAILAHTHGLDAATVQAVLEDTDAKNFCWSADEFAWRALRVTTAEIVRARQDLILSFGSCSFDEPREELYALGWLP